MGCFLLQLLIITFFFVSGILSIEHQPIRVTKNQVHVINDIPDSPEPLRVRCTSLDIVADLHTLKKGQELNWTFGPDASGSAVYPCHFYWQSKNKLFNVYDGRVRQYCRLPVPNVYACYWSARPDGFYVSNDESSWKKIYGWG
ncbi:S-protein homolog 29-like [Rhododendron vialii]|uniref:S-protein homolog 29-like n=1 Tax=Rhododendron vialii TaxID=182163 RepID=UPI0026604DF9|nr:S-protein homolog 29-like [Rhododendron vialii]